MYIRRITHSQSQSFSTGTSVKNHTGQVQAQILYEQLLPSQDYTVTILERYKYNNIFIHEIEYKMNYIQSLFSCESDIHTIKTIVTKKISYITISITFGVAPCLNEWCVISETVTNYKIP